LQDKTS
jgi:hypothetical protein